MNEQLIKFIELCLADGFISDKEREVIFRKSKELGVLEDECEIILEGMITKLDNTNSISNVRVEEPKNEEDSFDKDFILNFQNDVLLNIEKSLKFLDDKLSSFGDLKQQFKSEDFIEWFKDLPNHLQRYSEGGYIEIRDSRWNKYETFPVGTNFWQEYIEGEIKHVLMDSSDKKIIKIEKRLSDNPILITTDGIYSCEKEFKTGGLFKSDRYVYSNFNKIKGVSEVDIFHEEDIQYLGSLVKFYVEHHYVEYDIDYMVSELDKLRFDKEEVLQVLNESSIHNNDIIKLNFEINRLVNLYNDYIKGNRFTINLNNPIKTHLYNLSFLEVDYRNYKYVWVENKYGIQILNTIESQLKTISNLIVLRNQMILLAKENKNNQIELIKVELDELGLLMNKFEKDSLNKLDDIKDSIKKGFSMMSSMISTLNNSIKTLNESTNKVSHGISKLESSMGVLNTLSLINTYQLYKVNKNTKNLR